MQGTSVARGAASSWIVIFVVCAVPLVTIYALWAAYLALLSKRGLTSASAADP